MRSGMPGIMAAALVAGCAHRSPAFGRGAEPLPSELRAPPGSGPDVEVPFAPVPVDMEGLTGAAALPDEQLASDRNGSSIAATAQERPITLEEVLGAARERAATVLAAAARADAAAGRRQEAVGRFIPTADASAGASHLRGRHVGSFGDVRDDLSFTTFEGGIGARLRVNPGAELGRAIAEAHAGVAAELEVVDAERRAMLVAASHYHDLLFARAASDIAREREQNAIGFRDIARARAVAGVGTEADVARAEIELARARNAVIAAQETLSRSSIALATLLRWDPEVLLWTREDTVRAWTAVDDTRTTELLSRARTARPDLRSAEARARAVSHRASAAWWDVLGPELDLGVRERLIGVDAGDLGGATLAYAIAGISVGWGEIGSARAKAAEARAASIEAQATREQVHAEVLEALAAVRARAQAIPEAMHGVHAAERNHDIQRARFEAGTGLGIEMIEAQTALAAARLDLVEAVIRYNVGQLRLLAVVGHLAPISVRAAAVSPR